MFQSTHNIHIPDLVVLVWLLLILHHVQQYVGFTVPSEIKSLSFSSGWFIGSHWKYLGSDVRSWLSLNHLIFCFSEGCSHLCNTVLKEAATLDIANLDTCQCLNPPFEPFTSPWIYNQPRVSRPEFKLETNSTVACLYAGGASLILPDVRFGTVSLDQVTNL